jgi:hypothetical protein
MAHDLPRLIYEHHLVLSVCLFIVAVYLDYKLRYYKTSLGVSAAITHNHT